MALFISSLSVILSYNLLEGISSVVVITFTIIPLIPIITRFYEYDDFDFSKLKNIFGRRSLFTFYSWLFFGLIVSFSFWYTFLPESVSSRVFNQQLSQYYDLGYNKNGQEYQFNYKGFDPRIERCDAEILNELISAYDYDIINCEVVLPEDMSKKSYLIYLGSNTRFADLIYRLSTGTIYPYKDFLRYVILSHNLKLLMFIFLTSFIFGAGSLFIISWNASIIAVHIGETSLRFFSVMNGGFFAKIGAYFAGFFYAMGQIFFHGILEFGGFFIAAIAGGVISISLLKHDLRSKTFRKIGLQCLALFLLSMFLIIMAAYVETR
ncbi:stage II sporulation protein M [Candidatus Woesearchaeota archaeon]|nr:stage II sporulation protein M [Candidatus Woesearchaeota archaeon]